MALAHIAHFAVTVLCLPALVNAQGEVIVEIRSPTAVSGSGRVCAESGVNQPNWPIVTQPVHYYCLTTHTEALVSPLQDGVHVEVASESLSHFNGFSNSAQATVTCRFQGWGRGEFILTGWSGRGLGSSPTGASARVLVDGVIQIDRPSLFFPLPEQTVTIPSTPDQPVDVRIECSASSGAVLNEVTGAAAYAIVRFVPYQPSGAQITSHGRGCGAQFTVTDAPGPGVHDLNLHMTGGIPNGLALLTIGFEVTGVPLPGAPVCFLYAPPFAQALLTTDGLGVADQQLELSAPINGQIVMQAFPFDLATGTLRTSPAQIINFVD